MSHLNRKIKQLCQDFMRELLFLEHPKKVLQFVVTLPTGIKIGASAMSTALKPGQFVDFQVEDVNSDGSDSPLPAGQAPTVSSSDPTVLSLSVAPDGVSTRVTALKDGSATVTATVGAFTATADFVVATPVTVTGITINVGPVQG